jgi:immune inhibitor A
VIVVVGALAVLGLTTHPASVDIAPTPYLGDHTWWSFYGNNLDTTLELTNPLDLNGAENAGLIAWVNYEAEEGYDFLFGEVSIDGGESWARLNGTVGGESIWSESEDDVEGFSGKSGDADEDGETDWVELFYDLSPLEGETEVWFRFRYITDSSSVSKGFYIDEIVIAGDVDETVTDGAETDDNGPWTPKGFVKAS